MREFVVVNCWIDLTVIDWPLDVSFRTKRCKCVELESDKNWFGASGVLLRMYDIYIAGTVHSLIYTTANFECFRARFELQNSRVYWRLAADKCKICTYPLPR